MIISVAYQIPVLVYVDTKSKEVTRVCVDDQATFFDGLIEGVDGIRGEAWGEQITPASKGRLLRAHEAIQADATNWPAWDIGF